MICLCVFVQIFANGYIIYTSWCVLNSNACIKYAIEIHLNRLQASQPASKQESHPAIIRSMLSIAYSKRILLLLMTCNWRERSICLIFDYLQVSIKCLVMMTYYNMHIFIWFHVTICIFHCISEVFDHFLAKVLRKYLE